MLAFSWCVSSACGPLAPLCFCHPAGGPLASRLACILARVACAHRSNAAAAAAAAAMVSTPPGAGHVGRGFASMPVKHMAEAGLAAGLSTLAETAVVVSTVNTQWHLDKGPPQLSAEPNSLLLQQQQQCRMPHGSSSDKTWSDSVNQHVMLAVGGRTFHNTAMSCSLAVSWN